MIEPGSIETRAPIPGESLYGYVADTTGDNKLGRVALIAGDADRQYGHRPQLATTGWDSLPALAELLEVDVAELQLRSYPFLEGDTARRAFFGTSISKMDLTTMVRRFSPAALAKTPFHRAMWQLRIPFDIETREILLSNCSLCAKLQGWRHSAGVAFCDSCGESLDQPADRFREDLQDDVALAVGLTHSNAATRASSLELLPAEIQQLGPAMAFELLLRLVPVARPDCTWTSQDRIWHNDPHLIAEAMTSAWQILVNWPRAMKARISTDIATASARFSDGNGGATRSFLHLRNSAYLPASLRAVIARLHESIDLAGPNAFRLRRQTMTSKEGAQELSYGTSELVALRRGGVFRTIGLVRGSRLIAVFDRNDVLQVARDVEQKRSLNSVNEDLGLPYYAIEQLCALGYLTLLQHPYFGTRFSRLQTTNTAFERLRDKLVAGQTEPREGDIRLQAAMQMVGGRLKPWDAVIEAMLVGDLAYSIEVGTSPLFRRVCVQRDELRAHIAVPITRGHAETHLSSRIDRNFRFALAMPKRDAAEVLNLGTNDGTKVLEQYPTSSGAIVPVGDVEALAEKFVASVELTARLGTPYRLIDSAAQSIDVQRCEAGYLRRDEIRLLEAIDQQLRQKRRNSPIIGRLRKGRPETRPAKPDQHSASNSNSSGMCVCRRSPWTSRVGARERLKQWRHANDRGRRGRPRRLKGQTGGVAYRTCSLCLRRHNPNRAHANRVR